MAKKKKSSRTTQAMLPASYLDLKNPKPGVYLGVPLLDYLEIDAFSQSQAKEILKSPAHLQAYLRKGPDTDALRLGSLLDARVFDPETVKRDFSQTPMFYENEKGEEKLWAKRSSSKAAAAIKEKLEEGGKLLVKRDAWEATEKMVESLISFPPAAKALSSKGTAQVTMIWIDSETGILCKARVDWWTDNAIYDLKSTLAGGAHQLQWPREIWKYRYDVQAGAYVSGRSHLCGGELVSFKWLVVEKVDPFMPMVYRIGPETQHKGDKEWARALSIFKECTEIDLWGGYSTEEEMVECYSYNLVESMTAQDCLGEGVEDYGI